MSFRSHSDLCAVRQGKPRCSCSGNKRDCIHDLLKRACTECELEAAYVQLEAAKAVIEAFRRYVKAPWNEVGEDETKAMDALADAEKALAAYDARKGK